MVIVKEATGEQKAVEKVKTNSLGPYQKTYTPDPYITAYLNVSDLSLPFVIGDEKRYYFNGMEYLNKHLKQNTSYIAFMRFFENEVNFQNEIDTYIH